MSTVVWYFGAFLLAWALGYVMGQKLRAIRLALISST